MKALKVITFIGLLLTIFACVVTFAEGGSYAMYSKNNLEMVLFISFPAAILGLIFIILAKSGDSILKNNFIYLWIKRKTLEEKNKLKELEEKAK